MQHPGRDLLQDGVKAVLSMYQLSAGKVAELNNLQGQEGQHGHNCSAKHALRAAQQSIM